MAEQAAIVDRAAGALVGALIGDGLGVGPHWYYDLGELQEKYGPWISGYTAPRKSHYHEGLKPGQASQEGVIALALLEQVARRGGYVQGDFTRWLDETFLPQIDGEPYHGPGGYTSHSIRDLHARRVLEKKDWSETGGTVDTTEAAQRAFVLAVRYAFQPGKLVDAVHRNTSLTQTDPTVLALTSSYSLVLAALVRGEELDEELSKNLVRLAKSGVIPYYFVVKQSPDDPDFDGRKPYWYPSPDSLLTLGDIVRAVKDPAIQIEPAWKVGQLYGLSCAIYHQIPAAYHLSVRFADDFEKAVLNAINGGGQNLARATLVGALVGAHVGLSGIPARFLAGLEGHERILTLARTVGEALAKEAGEF